MASIKLTDDLNSYLNKNDGGGDGGLSAYFNRDNFVTDKFNQNIGSWFGSQSSTGERYDFRNVLLLLAKFSKGEGDL